jgi:hypothetical protein
MKVDENLGLLPFRHPPCRIPILHFITACPGVGVHDSSTHSVSSLRRDAKIEKFDTKM